MWQSTTHRFYLIEPAENKNAEIIEEVAARQTNKPYWKDFVYHYEGKCKTLVGCKKESKGKLFHA